MRKCRAELFFCGKWLEIVSTYRPLLCSTIEKMYSENKVHELSRACTRKEINFVVDVGACIGGHSIIYKFAFPQAQIYAIEPSTLNYADLIVNARQLPGIVPLNIAAWDKNETVEIALTTSEQKSHCHSVENVGQISAFGQSDHHREKVQALRLDDIFERVDYLKVDAEGADYQVLQGAKRLLRESRPILQLEMVPTNLEMGGTTMGEYLDYIQSLDYAYADAMWGNDMFFVPGELLTNGEAARTYRVNARRSGPGVDVVRV